jgi:hypothetical protein
MRMTVVQNSKSVRASGLPQVTQVFHDNFSVKAYQDFFSGLIRHGPLLVVLVD